MKVFGLVFALTALLFSLATPALCISVSMSSGTGGGSVSTSTSYDLDDSTRLQEQTVLVEGQLVQSREATGSGDNLIDQSVGGDGYSVNNVIDSSGSFRTSASTVASSTSAGLSQSLAGNGDLSTSIDGITASGSSGQISEVTGGSLSTTQTLAAANGVYAGQNTQLSGQTGGIGSSSFSAGNEINVAGGFSGEGNLEADLLAMATDRSFVDGDASFLGVSVLGDETMQTLNSGDVGYSVDALYALPGSEIGTFGLSATNYLGDGDIGSDTSSLLSGPAVTSTGGNSNAYWLSGKKWTQLNPQVKMSVNAAGSGLTTTQMQGAVSAAAETWDAATNQNLFSDGGAVSTTAVQGKYDKQNVISFLKYNPGCTALASAGTWYRLTKVNGFYPIVESDIAFNSNYRWTTTGASGAYDFQSVALHEMGHTIGLGDLYNKAAFSKDSRQVMHYYTGAKRTLGNGDATGVWKLYG
jgi:hypothetical protein